MQDLNELIRALASVTAPWDTVYVLGSEVAADEIAREFHRFKLNFEFLPPRSPSLPPANDAGIDTLVYVSSVPSDIRTARQLADYVVPGGAVISRTRDRSTVAPSTFVTDVHKKKTYTIFRNSPLADPGPFSCKTSKLFGVDPSSKNADSWAGYSPTKQFKNPWIYRSLLDRRLRIQDDQVRRDICWKLLESTKVQRDRAAALFVIGDSLRPFDPQANAWGQQVHQWFNKEQKLTAKTKPWKLALAWTMGQVACQEKEYRVAQEWSTRCAQSDANGVALHFAVYAIQACLRLAQLATSDRYIEQNLRVAAHWWSQAAQKAQTLIRKWQVLPNGDPRTFLELNELRRINNLACFATDCLTAYQFNAGLNPNEYNEIKRKWLEEDFLKA